MNGTKNSRHFILFYFNYLNSFFFISFSVLEFIKIILNIYIFKVKIISIIACYC